MDKWLTVVAIITIIGILILAAWTLPVHSEVGYEPVTITVHYGDTLTGYARQYAPEMNVREYIDEVKRINRMTDGMLYAGDEIVILKEAER